MTHSQSEQEGTSNSNSFKRIAKQDCNCLESQKLNSTILLACIQVNDIVRVHLGGLVDI